MGTALRAFAHPTQGRRLALLWHAYCGATPTERSPYDAGNAAHMRMIAETPANADKFIRMAHYYPPGSSCLHDEKNQKPRAKTEAREM